jgi:hypothetical protein
MVDACVSTESGSDRIERLRQSLVLIPSLPLRILTRCVFFQFHSSVVVRIAKVVSHSHRGFSPVILLVPSVKKPFKRFLDPEKRQTPG